MLSFNFWLGLSTDFKTELWQYIRNGDEPPVEPVQFPLLTNLSQDTKDFFNAIYDEGTLDRLFLGWNNGSKDFKLLSFYANKPENVSQVRSDLDNMIATYPNDFSVLGAWHCADGRQIGTDWDSEEPPQIIGSPIYPVPAYTLNFMPDIIDNPGDPGGEPPVPPTFKRPTQLSDINVLFGQVPRIFPVL